MVAETARRASVGLRRGRSSSLGVNTTHYAEEVEVAEGPERGSVVGVIISSKAETPSDA